MNPKCSVEIKKAQNVMQILENRIINGSGQKITYDYVNFDITENQISLSFSFNYEKRPEIINISEIQHPEKQILTKNISIKQESLEDLALNIDDAEFSKELIKLSNFTHRESTSKVQKIVEKIQLNEQKNNSMNYVYLYDRFKESLYHYLLKFVKNKNSAEDIMQETFTKAFKNIQQYSSEKGNFSTWLFRIGKNNAVDYIRREKIKHPESLLLDIYKTEDGSDPLERVLPDKNRILYEESQHYNIQFSVVNLLDEKYKRVLYLLSMKYSYDEIASELNMPMGTLKGTVNRGRIRLMNLLMDKHPLSYPTVEDFSRTFGWPKKTSYKNGIERTTSLFEK